MKYEVQTQPEVGTLNQLVWLVRVNEEQRTVEVWNAETETWHLAPEGDSVRHSFKVPFKLLDQVVRALAEPAGLALRDTAPAGEVGVRARAVSDLEDALTYIDDAVSIVDDARLRLKQG